MSVRFQCPQCQSVRTVNERMLGKEIRCPDCSANVQLPTVEEYETAKREAKAAAEKKKQEAAFTASLFAEAIANKGKAKPKASSKPVAEPEVEEEESLEFQKPKSRDDSEMDMTPMVDVTFLLLIFFMITASFSIQKVFKTPAQKSNEASVNSIPDPEKENEDAVVVQVDEFNSYTVLLPNEAEPREVPSKQDLIVLLTDARAGDGAAAPQKLTVQAHENSVHAAIIAALDAGRDAQFSSFEVSTVEEFD